MSTSDLLAIKGKAIVSKQTLIRLLALSVEIPLGRDSSLFDIGVNTARREMREVLVSVLPEHKRADPLVQLVRDLRDD